jgi:hypothetical protein
MPKGKKILASFASGEFYERKRSLNSFTAKHIAKFDLIKEFTLKDISSAFYGSNERLFSIKKGAGLWLWKPYFIFEVLKEAEFGDYIFHCDTASVFIRNINPIIEVLDSSGQDVMLFSLPLKEKEWTSQYTLDKLNVSSEDQNTNQITASFIVVKKSKTSLGFVKEWLELCQNEDLLSGQPFKENNSFPEFHRYDQSLLSLLAKKNNFKTYRDPSQYGIFPEMYRTHGSIMEKNDSLSNYNSSILLLRKGGVVSQLCKFFIKSAIKYVSPTVYKKIVQQ